MLLVDRLANMPVQFATDMPAADLRRLPSLTKFDITNINHYYEMNKQVQTASELFALRSPFPALWMESPPAPFTFVGDELVPSDMPAGSRKGWLVTCVAGDKFEGDGSETGNLTDSDFVLDIQLYAGTPQMARRACFLTLGINSDGTPWQSDAVMGSVACYAEPIEARGHSLQGAIIDSNMPAMLALMFLNCRNVQRIERGGPRHLKGAPRRTRQPSSRYYVLDIEAMKKILDGEGQAQENGLPKALHVCRGHFKDYREHGLFGRNKGIYWWDNHLRGNPDAGTVDKDYRMPEVSA